jgi:hypothetical protein
MIIAVSLCLFTTLSTLNAFSRDFILLEVPNIFVDKPGVEKQAHATVRQAVRLTNL